MKKKFFLGLLALFMVTVSYSQSATFNSIKVGGSTITGVSNDTTGGNQSTTKALSEAAAKRFVIGRLNNLPSTVPYTGATSSVNLGSNNITSNAFIKSGATSTDALMGDGTTQTFTPKTGIIWTSNQNMTNSNSNNDWRSVCYGNGLFVAVASSGTGNRVMISNSGFGWTACSSAADNNWRSVCYGKGMFVAVANTGTGNRVMTSPDGINWTLRNSAADNNWSSVCYGNGLFVAVANTGTGNRVMTSPDGINWTLRNSSVDNNWTSVCYGNGIFMSVANSGTANRVMTSPDGINWSSKNSQVLNSSGSLVDLDLSCIAYNNGFWVATNTSGTSIGFIISINNGQGWFSKDITGNPTSQLSTICYGNGLLVGLSNITSFYGGVSYFIPDLYGTLTVGYNSGHNFFNNNYTSACYGNGMFVAVCGIGSGSARVAYSGFQDRPINGINSLELTNNNIASGIFSPTITNVSNATGLIVDYATYTNVAGVYTVQILFSLTSSSVGVTTRVDIALPVVTSGTFQFIGGSLYGNGLNSLPIETGFVGSSGVYACRCSFVARNSGVNLNYSATYTFKMN